MVLVRSWASRTIASVFESTPAAERWLVYFRIGACPILMLVVFLDRPRLPYWELAIGGLATVLLANLFLWRLLRKRRDLLVATLGTLVDTAMVLGISSRSISSSALLDTTSDMWLIYPLVILLAAYHLRPAFMILYTFLLSAWYGAHVAIFFAPTSRTYTELPVRLGFFILMGMAVTAMAHALRSQGSGAMAPRQQADQPSPEETRTAGSR